MKILYDGFIFEEQIAGGINRYFMSLFRNLPENISKSLTISSQALKRSVDLTDDTQAVDLLKFSHPRPKRFFQQFADSLLSQRLKKETFDIIHPTYYFTNKAVQKKFPKLPKVISVYDMIHEKFPNLDPLYKVRKAKEEQILSADKIICISESTKHDLLEFYPSVRERVSVVYLGTNFHLLASQPLSRLLDQPYLLFVGERSGYKNFKGASKAFAAMLQDYPRLLLVVVGKLFSKTEKQWLRHLGVEENIRVYCQIQDDQLASLYKYSLGLIYASQYEGFGLPPLEAFACRVPVVAGKHSSIAEILGDYPLLCDVRNFDELQTNIRRLLEDRESLSSFTEQAFVRSEMFSWDKTALETAKVYSECL